MFPEPELYSWCRCNCGGAVGLCASGVVTGDVWKFLGWLTVSQRRDPSTQLRAGFWHPARGGDRREVSQCLSTGGPWSAHSHVSQTRRDMGHPALGVNPTVLKPPNSSQGFSLRVIPRPSLVFSGNDAVI